MFNLKHGDELCFQIPNSSSAAATTNSSQAETITQDVDQVGSAEGSSTGIFTVTDTSRCHRHDRSMLANKGVAELNVVVDEEEKKKMHREVERQRRQEMNRLYSELRSLLPLEFIKGTRSISDQMHQATVYIEHLQLKIKEHSIKRNKVQKMYNIAGENIGSSSNVTQDTVRINYSHGVIEISINSCFKEESFPLARVLELLLQEGLDVLGCIYTKVNERLHHTIQCEVGDLTSVDLSSLKEKLSAIINR